MTCILARHSRINAIEPHFASSRIKKNKNDHADIPFAVQEIDRSVGYCVTIEHMTEEGIKLYIADHVKLGLQESWREMFDTLPETDRERIGGYRFDADRIRGTLGAAMIRHFAGEAFPEEEIVIERDEYGKPYLSGHEGFEFSLSHSGDMVVLAISDKPVGADVETVKGKDWRMFHRFLSEEEMKMIETAKEPEGRFFEVWTVREAFSKEEGKGLRILDEAFTVDYDRKEIGYKGKILYFKTISHTARGTGYKISVCSPLPLNKLFITEVKTCTEYMRMMT